ncbi:hypothetical protein DPMN_030178 [Dreissena polymorpha]|uniref:Uncharacterized protein n=1 Tax=Dreissena polymorpha TaxID=45954 RepID=A0A9D4LYJ7_DREPO|nr:hypothetical protein DPMN_030178 [Dreissena polymorpha]
MSSQASSGRNTVARYFGNGKGTGIEAEGLQLHQNVSRYDSLYERKKEATRIVSA